MAIFFLKSLNLWQIVESLTFIDDPPFVTRVGTGDRQTVIRLKYSKWYMYMYVSILNPIDSMLKHIFGIYVNFVKINNNF